MCCSFLRLEWKYSDMYESYQVAHSSDDSVLDLVEFPRNKKKNDVVFQSTMSVAPFQSVIILWYVYFRDVSSERRALCKKYVNKHVLIITQWHACTSFISVEK